MAFLPNNPNTVNVAPNAATAPRPGFWNEKKVAWMVISAYITDAPFLNAFGTPWTTEGYTQKVTNVLEQRGTIIGMNNDESPVQDGTGANLYVCYGYAAGEFIEGTTVKGTAAAVIGDPPTLVGDDPILSEFIVQILTGYPYPGTTLEISIGGGFVVVPVDSPAPVPTP